MEFYNYTLWDRLSGKFTYCYNEVKKFWRQHHYINPLYAAGRKLIELNPEIMPATVSIRTWTRFWGSLICDVRFKKFDEKRTAGAGMVTKNGDTAYMESANICWLWLYRNHERYVIKPQGMDPQGMDKEKDYEKWLGK